jgi:hypothetical protein
VLSVLKDLGAKIVSVGALGGHRRPSFSCRRRDFDKFQEVLPHPVIRDSSIVSGCSMRAS